MLEVTFPAISGSPSRRIIIDIPFSITKSGLEKVPESALIENIRNMEMERGSAAREHAERYRNSYLMSSPFLTTFASISLNGSTRGHLHVKTESLSHRLIRALRLPA